MRKRWRTVFIGLGLIIVLELIAVGVVYCYAPQRIDWIGGTELTIVFVVTDAETGQPIDGAEVRLDDTEGRHVVGNESSTLLKTGKDGCVNFVLPDCRCGGSVKNTRVVNVPTWTVVCTAPGGMSDEPFWLHEFSRKVKQTGPVQDRLTVPISLRKSQP